MLSTKFHEAIRNTGKPMYLTAHAAGIHPSTLYQITSGCLRPKPGDKRVTKLAAVLGLPESACYINDEQ